MEQQYVSDYHTYKQKISGPGHDDCYGVIEHMQKRINELARDNEELRQKTQVVVKKVETNVVEKKPGLDEESAQRITELERKLSETELLAKQRFQETEEYKSKVVRFTNLQADFDVLKNRNWQSEQQLNEKCQELDALRKKYAELEALHVRDNEIANVKEAEVMELHKKLKELEVLPSHLATAKKNTEVLNSEIERLTTLAKERDHEITFLRQKINEVDSLRCISPRDHDDLKARIAYTEKLEYELAELKDKYASLCTEYEKEISIVRSKDKEISSINKELQHEIKESRKALDREINQQEKLEREIEKLKKLLAEREFEIEEWKKKTVIISEIQTSCKNLETENRRLQDRLRKLEEMNHQLEVKVASLIKEIDALRDELKRREKAYSILEKEKNSLVAEFEKSQKESSATLAKVNETKNSEIKALTIKLDKLNQEVVASQREIDDLRRECDTLNNEKVRISKVLQEHTAQEKELLARIEAMKKDRDLLTKEIADLSAEKDKLKGFAYTKGKEVGKLDKNINQLEAENDRLHKVAAELEERVKAANNLLKERENEIASLRNSMQNITISQKDICDERDRLLNQNSTLAQRISELEISVTTITNKYNKLEKIHNEIKGATHHLADVHDKLVETCEETEKISHSGPQIVEQKAKIQGKSQVTHLQ